MNESTDEDAETITTDRPGACTFSTCDLATLGTGSVQFDVVVIGSGYGAAIATHHLSQCRKDGKPLSICVLERGKEYLDGSFPTDATELPGHVRTSSPESEAPTGNLDALFDVRMNPDVSSLVANGFGGGSLINAGVMIEPLPSAMGEDWPIKYEDLPFQASRRLLQARALNRDKLPKKYDELKKLAPETKPAEITVFDTCNSCGNCATGCNFGHKASLDRTLFAQARQYNPEIKFITGATVEHIEKTAAGWQTRVIPTRGDVRLRMEAVVTMSDQIVLAAGTFGSTEILMKSRDKGLGVSSQLGQRFSSNGDMLAVGFHRKQRVNAISRSPLAGSASSDDVGPTITGVADFRASHGVLLQEMNVPFPIAPFFDEIFSTSASVSATTRFDWSYHSPKQSSDETDPFSLNSEALAHTSVYAMMSDDGSAGELRQTRTDGRGDSFITVNWPELKNADVFKKQLKLLSTLSARTGGTVIANPVWQPLPEALSFLARDAAGPLVTVHPLGGCAMANANTQGVVNHRGEVFDGKSATSVHDGLVVLDGSIIPRSPGANPALTISAVALRAVRLLATDWGYEPCALPLCHLPERKSYRQILPSSTRPTRVQVVERMVGPISIKGVAEALTLELTLFSKPTAVRDMISGPDRSIRIADQSYMRIYKTSCYESLNLNKAAIPQVELELDKIAIVKYGLEGELRLFPRARSFWPDRMVRGAAAHLLNRGIRDAWQWGAAKLQNDPSAGGFPFSSMLQTWVHAGEKRTMDYSLTLQRPLKTNSTDILIAFSAGDQIKGQKLITYKRAANPLRQMSEMMVSRLGSYQLSRRDNVVKLDPEFLARAGVPLIHVVEQNDSVSAMLDLMALLGYVARMLFSVHALTFRLPDTYKKAPLSRLPDRIPGVPDYEQIPLVDAAGRSLPALLTRYKVKQGPPVLLMHGYSASGTTFAHESLPMPFARYLYEHGYDVWLLDARTSPGLPSGFSDWTFESVAEEDIPVAVQHVHRVTGQKVNVVAHCMGAGMFSMAVLRDKSGMDDLINRAVLTQVGPGVVVSPGNVFRAYALRYLKQFFNLERFDLRVDNSDSLADQLIDRLLNILPYSDEEFKRENPAWPPWKRTEWVGIRHRMDMLWGETFALRNVGDEVLDHIDAMFGTLNLETLSQVIPLSKWMNVTDAEGNNRYFQHHRLQKHWQFDTLSLHTAENGLWSPATLYRNRRFFDHVDCRYQTELIKDFGHQDIWLSDKSAKLIYPRITGFLEQGHAEKSSGASNERKAPPVPESAPEIPEAMRYVRTPYLGPIVSHDVRNDGVLTTIVRFGKRPNVGMPFLALILEVTECAAEADQQGGEQDQHLMSVVSLDEPGWIDQLPAAVMFSEELPMYRMEVALEPNKQYLLLLINAENADLGIATIDQRDQWSTSAISSHAAQSAMVSVTQARLGPEQLQPTVTVRGRGFGQPTTIETLSQSVGSEINELLIAHPERIRQGLIRPKSLRPEGAISIAFGSCQYNAGLIDEQVAYQSYQKLCETLETDGPLDLLLLLGDQIYVDATAGLFDPQDQVMAYREPYTKWLSNRYVRRVLRELPSYMMLDDHEISDNWEPGHCPRKYEQGVTAFAHYQFGGERDRDPDQFWGPIKASPLPLFMLNTRTDRSVRTPDQIHEARMIGASQFSGLLRWLDEMPQAHQGQPCIISSAALLLPRHYPLDTESGAAFRLDTIDGYPATFNALIEMMVDRPLMKFVFVSGDEHIPLIVDIDLLELDGTPITKCHAVHTSSLYAPYPFANSQPEQVINHDRFTVELSTGRQIICAVEIEHLDPISGFTRLEIGKTKSSWMLEVEMIATGERRFRTL